MAAGEALQALAMNCSGGASSRRNASGRRRRQIPALTAHLRRCKKNGAAYLQSLVFTGVLVVGADGLEPPTYAL